MSSTIPTSALQNAYATRKFYGVDIQHVEFRNGLAYTHINGRSYVLRNHLWEIEKSLLRPKRPTVPPKTDNGKKKVLGPLQKLIKSIRV
jgi:hypothetical protein